MCLDFIVFITVPWHSVKVRAFNFGNRIRWPGGIFTDCWTRSQLIAARDNNDTVPRVIKIFA